MIAGLCKIILKAYTVLLDIAAVQSIDGSFHVDDVIQSSRFWCCGTIFDETIEICSISVW